MPAQMYIADQLGVIGGKESKPIRKGRLTAEIDIQLHQVREAKKQILQISILDIENFIKNVEDITDGPEYLSAMVHKFPKYEYVEPEEGEEKTKEDDDKDERIVCNGVDKYKWRDACNRGEIPFPPKVDGHVTDARDVYWYDAADKQMLHFKCDNLEFIYDTELGKQIPVPIMSKIKTEHIKNNRDDILAWVDRNEDDFGLDVVDFDNKTVIVGFPEYIDDIKMRDIVESSMYAERFRYQIDG